MQKITGNKYKNLQVFFQTVTSNMQLKQTNLNSQRTLSYE